MGKDIEERAKTPDFREQPESLEHRLWRIGVLHNHKETTEDVKKAIKNIKHAEKTVRRSIVETRKVVDTWNEYSDKYDDACRKFSKRINRSMQRDEILKLIMNNKLNVNTHHREPTKCYLTKKQTKIIPYAKRRPFSGY